ncbi:MAG: ABC transporter permease, partial [Candidatus Zixiibacteriota bacterium]
MVLNYLRTSLRNIVANRGYSVVSILGLAISMAICIPIVIWILHQLSYDEFHANSDRLALVVRDAHIGAQQDIHPKLPAPFAPALRENIPGVDAAVRICRGSGGLSTD